MKYKFFDQRAQECHVAMIQALQNLATQLEQERCQESRLVEKAVSKLVKAKIRDRQTVTAIEKEIANTLDSE
ncbi:MAG: hypothetical protein IGS49_14810 [Chlorogloeopsis fritschii C42_A2020_084]|uniref:hypothetical protein n=1 Tax=Chlorogloeopsis fritschii TaxID=1124 RepID=UPI0019FD7EE8|nr:hypothetical protein [Chlorogloeopsis fritschii]MBF2006696.1 hypothetical protein [Chlorogloeopsis fritschii C42_A2020_084]